jgi:hypothetical protein
MEHNKFIVITSIFPPTEAVVKFSKVNGYRLIVVGDKKTPPDWNCPDSIFLAVEENGHDFSLHSKLPYNHYCRKMLGYLYAIRKGAEMIVDTDDDNIPVENWGFPNFHGTFGYYDEKHGFVNIYNYFTDQHIWPRGLPLNLINTRNDFAEIEQKDTKVGIWQGLADGDPDVDAIYRLTSDSSCVFREMPPVVLGKNVLTPFNTQNTVVCRELFPLMYLPVTVTFRFTDILRGLIAQPVMWLYDFYLGFTNATVIQKRNPHDYFKDFISEIPMYQHCENIVSLVTGVISGNKSITHNLYDAYDILIRNGIVSQEELPTLKAWLMDMEISNF